jgi:hypothetical protein
MPSLLPKVWTISHPVVPYVWSCSECEAVFDAGQVRRSVLTRDQVDGINRQFGVHCDHVHPRSFPIVGLPSLPVKG